MPSTSANTASPGTFASLLSGPDASTNPGPGNLIGTGGTGGFLGSIYGRIPGVANPTSSAAVATAGDIGDLTQIANLTQGADTISAAGAELPFNMNLPDYEGMLTSATGNVSSELEGKVPQDVIDQLSQSSAERGVATGQGGGSPDTNAAFERALKVQQLGLDDAMRTEPLEPSQTEPEVS